jgi:ppGpp synthetase/RelA/SpoT-type nucleotidyltranferase
LTVNDLLLNKIDELFPVLAKLSSYSVKRFSSLKRTIDRFSFDDVFDEILDYFEEQDSQLSDLGDYLKAFDTPNIDVGYRLKSEDSLHMKWEKNMGRHKQLREVCNDVIGIRLIANYEPNVFMTDLLNLKSQLDYTIDIVNFYETPKSNDDGYRGIHLYFRNNPKCFPIEIQIWSYREALLNFYTHEVIYKRKSSTEAIQYSMQLRHLLDRLPDAPNDVEMSFVDYLYKVVYSQYGGG